MFWYNYHTKEEIDAANKFAAPFYCFIFNTIRGMAIMFIVCMIIIGVKFLITGE